MRHLYADTSVWNCLCDQNADPRALTTVLANSSLVPAIGFNVLFEIAKLFFTGTEAATERGQELFGYMKGYFSLRLPIVKENSALLIEEALDITGTAEMKSFCRNESDYETAIREVDKLCRGDVKPETIRFFENRKSLAQTSRIDMRDHLDARPDLKAKLSGISESALQVFLPTASIGPAGRFLLLGHLRKEFPGNSVSDLADVARLLLESPRYRLSSALTRADLYLNWRCVNRGSIRSDLPDDTFHIVSAAYCDVFVTTEADQADIARHAIEGIQTIVCNQRESIMERLVTETRRQRDLTVPPAGKEPSEEVMRRCSDRSGGQQSEHRR